MFSAQNPNFEIVGTDRRSVGYVDELSAHVAEEIRGYVREGGAAFPQRVFVTLRPSHLADFDGVYRIRREDRGFVAVDFRWTEELSLETVCRGLAEAYLVRYSIFHYGPDAPAGMRGWVLPALGVHSYLKLRPAQNSAFLEDLREAGEPDLEEFLGKPLERFEEGEAAMEARAGYWFLLGLRRTGFGRTVIRDLVEHSIAGGDAFRRLREVAGTADNPAAPDLLKDWWSGVYSEFTTRYANVFDTMRDSREWLGELIDFTKYGEDGDKEIPDLRGLWDEREDGELKGIVEARFELLLLRLQSVNPVYFNAAHALGSVFEAVLRSDRPHEFVRALTGFLGEFEDAKSLHKQTLELLEE